MHDTAVLQPIWYQKLAVRIDVCGITAHWSQVGGVSAPLDCSSAIA